MYYPSLRPVPLRIGYNFPVDQVDLDRRRHLGQPRHGHDVAADHDDEFRARSEAHLAHVYDVIRRRGAQLRISRERILGLRHAHRVVAVAVLLQLLDLSRDLGVRRDLARAVDLLAILLILSQRVSFSS